MRSKCRSLLISLSLLSAIGAFEIGAAPRFSFLQIAEAQAKGASDSATAGDGEAQDSPGGASGAKCASGAGQGAAPTPGSGRGRRFPGGFSAEGGFGHMALDLSMLNLSDEQKNKITAIRGRNAARAKELRQSLGTKRGEFRDLLFSESATNDQITAKRDEMRALKDEAENLMLSDFLAIRAVLTPEQRKKRADTKPPEHRPHPRGGGPGEPEPDKADKNASSTSVKVK